MPHAAPSPANGFHGTHAALLAESFARLIGKSLLALPPSTRGLAPEQWGEALWNAPFVVASHGTQTDPVFNYGNQAALRLWNMSWEEFTALPSRLSAEPVEQSQRRTLLDAVTARGFISDYSGVRISKTGARFRIERATVWNVIDPGGAYRGQAVCFSHWHDVS